MSNESLLRFERLGSDPFVTVSGGTGWTQTWTSLQAVLGHRRLLALLVRRDIKARYKDSFLGLLWTLINPIVQLVIYYVVMGLVLGAAHGIPDFAIYVFSGLTIFGLFSESLISTTGSILANSGLVKKVYVPREVFPLAAIGSSLFTFAVQLVVLIAATFLLASPPSPEGILYFLPSVLIIVVYATALGLLLSALNVYLRDVQYLTQVLLTIAMWASPIVYGWQMVSDVLKRADLPTWLLEVYTNNPLTLAVLGFHRTFWAAGTPADYPDNLMLRMLIAIGIGFVLLWLCQRTFARLQGNFAQEL
ncbi:ABC transporter permease [Microbacterium sp. ASV49]|uniref:Transport permease protein n=1 Tax=Microbacterium candidum TaxID=3041922 RepID=A0ABT7N0S8_9MICO|nr:ABC transporter permease [Microbacterium sp. ASV49]MDL9980316.1 ABC transporter permease [Microbacterium sp. ASV49]